MFLETNLDNPLPTRISLARASQLTGYHQDYLGQLCRSGKLQAEKIGRNWFTNPQALGELYAYEPLASQSDLVSQSDAQSDQVTFSDTPNISNLEVSDVATGSFSGQKFVDAIVGNQDTVEEEISEDERSVVQMTPATISAETEEVPSNPLPIAIKVIPPKAHVRQVNSVQNLLTNIRIENLQKEVVELRRMLVELMQEVKSHTNILQTRHTVEKFEGALKHAYISNFDFGNRFSTIELNTDTNDLVGSREELPPISVVDWADSSKAIMSKVAVFPWLAITMSAVVLGVLLVGIANDTFLGSSEPSVTTYYYRTNQIDSSQNTASVLLPEVAGASVDNQLENSNFSTGQPNDYMIR